MQRTFKEKLLSVLLAFTICFTFMPAFMWTAVTDVYGADTIVKVTFQTNGYGKINSGSSASKDVSLPVSGEDYFEFSQYENYLEGVTPNEGYVFLGWFTSAVGGSPVASNAKITTDRTVYAHWMPQFTTVTFNANGGTFSNGAKTQTVVRPYNTDLNTFVAAAEVPFRPGYTFEGWAAVQNATSANATSGSVQADKGLFAVWKKIPNDKVAVTFFANDGSGHFEVRIVDKNASYNNVVATVNNPVAENKKFNGWAQANGAGAPATFAEDTYLYAQWNTTKATVNFYSNDGTGKVTSVTKAKGTNFASFAQSVSSSRDGYTLKCWTGNLGEPTSMGNTAVDEDIDVYAVWEQSEFTVNIVKNNGTPTETKKVAKDTQVGSFLTKPSKEGYTFVGWTGEGSKLDTEGVQKNSGDLLDIIQNTSLVNSDMTIYAVWAKNHTHEWSYKVKGDDDTTVVAKCSCGAKATAKLTANDMVYTGSNYPVSNVKLNYSSEWKAYGLPETTITCQFFYDKDDDEDDDEDNQALPNAPKWDGRYKAFVDVKGVGLYAPFEIKPAKATYTAPTAKTGLVYSGKNLEAVNAGSSNLEYTVVNSSEFNRPYEWIIRRPWSSTVPTVKEAGTYRIYYRAQGDEGVEGFDAASMYVEVTVAKAQVGVKVAPEAKALVFNNENQTLITSGAADTQGFVLEYKLENGTWTEKAADIKGKATGTYTVWYRVALTDAQKANYKAADAQKLTVSISKGHVWTLTVNNTHNQVTAKCAESNCNVGGTLAFKLYAPDKAYDGKDYDLAYVEKSDKWTEANGLFDNYSLTYYNASSWASSGTPMTKKPVNAGTYYVVLSLNTKNTGIAATLNDAIYAQFTITKAAPTFTAPQAKTGLVYANKAQDLITRGTATNGTMEYYVAGKDATYNSVKNLPGWTTAMPQGQDAGTYKVFYRVKAANDNYADITDASMRVDVEIAKKHVGFSTLPQAYTNLKYNAESQNLIKGGVVEGNLGTPAYYVSDAQTTSVTKNFDVTDFNQIKRTEAGTYRVWYRINLRDTKNYAVDEPAYIDVQIAEDHVWGYTANGNVITAKCKDAKCSIGKMTLTLTADNMVYTGSKYDQISYIKTNGWDANGLLDPYQVIFSKWEDGKWVQVGLLPWTKAFVNGKFSGLDKAPTEVGKYQVEVKLASTPEVVAATTFEITQAAFDYSAPTAVSPLVWNGYEQTLVNAGYVSNSGYKMQYKIVGAPAAEGLNIATVNDSSKGWSDSLPRAKAAGTYKVAYRIVKNNDGSLDPNRKAINANIEVLVNSVEAAHNWKYSANGNVITAACQDKACEVTPATLTLITPDMDYSGGSYNLATVEFNGNWTKEVSGLLSKINADNVKVVYYECVGNNTKNLKKLNAAPVDAGYYLAAVTVNSAGTNKGYVASSTVDLNKSTTAINTVSAKSYFKINKVSFEGFEPPKAKTLTYNAKTQNLIDGGSVTGEGTMSYSLDGKTWTTDVNQIQGKDAKEYTVYWKLTANGNKAVESGKVAVFINPFEVGVQWGATTLVYDGQFQAPTAKALNVFTGDTCNLVVAGEQCDVTPSGESYLAKVNGTDNPNYTAASTAEKNFKIVKGKEKILLAKVLPTGSKNSYNLKVTWTPVKGAVTYAVYGAKCEKKNGKDYKSFKLLKKGIKGTSYTQKNLKNHSEHKYYVVAYDENGKKIVASNKIHAIAGKYNGKYGNVITIKATQKKFTEQKVGTVVQLNKKNKPAAEITTYKNKKPLDKWHAAKLRYLSEDTTIATVDSNGKVTLKRAGKVNIIIQAVNGMWVPVEFNIVE